MKQILLLILINNFLLVSGQFLWKRSLTNTTINPDWHSVQYLVLQPGIWGGLICFGIATFVWFMVLARADLSFAYPLQSLSYVAGSFIGIMFLNEKMTIQQWIGLCLILLGVFVISQKKQIMS